jgi:hypothetical protein
MNGWLVALLLFAITIRPRWFLRCVNSVRSGAQLLLPWCWLWLAMQHKAIQNSLQSPRNPFRQLTRRSGCIAGDACGYGSKFWPSKKMAGAPADSFARSGDYRLAAAFIQSGLKKQPKNGDLWQVSGVVLMLASDGELSEPAKLAFDRARIYAPRNAAPVYFEGPQRPVQRQAFGCFAEVGRLAKKLHPASAKWRKPLESQIGGLKQMLSTP